ncbi:HisA/HisF-related TIM barrel protein, partial [Prochlorococcus sp. AH-716-N14]|nr:HisA/HisF-related TIM barrel protein [Prochlorococcus sp. AH-716-N14]
MTKKVATLEKVSKMYGKDELIVKALDNVNLEIYKGDYLAVMGASGSGKSTAMNIIGCLDRPSQGVYKLNGTPVENLSDDELAELRNQKLGFVFQQFHLLSDATALENVLLPMIYAGADKVSLNSSAVKNPDIISKSSANFGTQCIVIAIDARKKINKSNEWEVYVKGGRENTGLDVISWAKKVEELGAGEILLTSMDGDGTQNGYDLLLTQTVANAVNIPVIASGGAGSVEDIYDVFTKGKA